MTIASQSQNLSITGGLIELYILDCSNIGGDIHYFTPNTAKNGGPVTWQGTPYFSLPISTSGWEYSGDGSQKKPQLMISNVTKTLMQAVIDLGDIVGAKLTRYQTFTNFLDGEPTADPTQFYPPDEFLIEQKLSHDRKQIVWQMCSVIDRWGIKLPRRQVTKDGDSRFCSFPAVGAFRLN